MPTSSGGGGKGSNNNQAYMYYIYATRRYQKVLDDITPFAMPRWLGTGFFFLMYCLRVLFLHGWYIVTYALAIYLLNLFLAFLSPKFDPALEEMDAAGVGNDAKMQDDDEGGGGLGLPMKNDEEFKPFIRRLPEFKFWYWTTRAITIAFTCTFFDAFDIPVFWPILLVYFFILFGLTMKRQIRHMVKYKYVPFDLGKKKYKAAPGGGAPTGGGKMGKD